MKEKTADEEKADAEKKAREKEELRTKMAAAEERRLALQEQKRLAMEAKTRANREAKEKAAAAKAEKEAATKAEKEAAAAQKATEQDIASRSERMAKALQGVVASPVMVRMHLKHCKSVATTPIDIIVHPEWAPLGAARFLDLIEQRYFDECCLYRFVRGFIIQWGIPSAPAEWKRWGAKKIKDDPVKVKNIAGRLAFAATDDQDSRGSQIFVNLGDNSASDKSLAGSDGNLDSRGFAPFAELANTADLAELNKCFEVKGLAGVDQDEAKEKGNAYMLKYFPELSRWTTAEVLGER